MPNIVGLDLGAHSFRAVEIEKTKKGSIVVNVGVYENPKLVLDLSSDTSIKAYSEALKEFFIESNPGLRSRFSRYYKFEHFYPQQLLAIMQSYCKSADFTLTEAATGKLLDMFEMMYEKRDDNFGNARVVRNVFERCVQNQANRLVNLPELTVHLLQTIEEQDINEPKYMVDQVFFTKSEK